MDFNEMMMERLAQENLIKKFGTTANRIYAETDKVDVICNAKNKFTPRKVIFNPPATIVLWEDNTKTVVKCSEDDIFNKEKGLAMCFAKKSLGNKGSYNNVFKKFINRRQDN